jgi:glycosyltransferase involved in cell wall biosynthesis
MGNASRRRICIEARVPDGASGGIQQVVLGLAAGLTAITDEEGEQYRFLVDEGAERWLAPYIKPPCELLRVPERLGYRLLAMARRGWADPLTVWRKLPIVRSVALPPPTVSDGFVEAAGAQVMHFPYQDAFLTRVPSIYHPHDLQHAHLPELFTKRERARRERLYGVFCRHASLVAVASSWVKRDVESHFGLSPRKVVVVPLAPPSAAYPTPSDAEIAVIRRRLALPDAFVFYPAQTWPHKNHLGLLEALAILRRRSGLRIPFVSSGHRNEHFRTVMERAKSFGLDADVRFVGYVSPVELQSLYRLARAVVIPSRFEAGSFPLWEAQLASVPVACSNVTSLPVQAGDSVLLFEPDRPEEIADAVERLWTDAALRQELVRRGRENVARFSWDTTARLFRAHYRQLGGWHLTDGDRALLASAPIM